MIRRAGASDAAAVAAVWNPIIRDTAITFTDREKTEEDIRALIEAQPFWIIEGGAGFATHGVFRAGPGYAGTREHTIHLAPGARGRGLGRALIEALQAGARADGYRVLIGAVSGSNPAGIAFHTAMGFQTAGRLPDVGVKGGRFHDLVLMLKPL